MLLYQQSTDPDKMRERLYRYALRRGYNCPSPHNYPKRFDLYIRTHNIILVEEEISIFKFLIQITIFLVAFGTILSVLY